MATINLQEEQHIMLECSKSSLGKFRVVCVVFDKALVKQISREGVELWIPAENWETDPAATGSLVNGDFRVVLCRTLLQN